MEVSESPCNEKTLKMWCKIFFLTNVCVTFQVQNTSIFVKGSVLRSFITKVRWMLRLRWLERCALLVSCQSSRTAVTNCSIIMLLLLTATTCLSTCRGCRGRWGSTVRETTLLRGWEVVDYREAWKIPSSLLNTVSGSVCLFCFWNANNTRDFWGNKGLL